MHEIQKSCFIGSIASHVFLVLLVLFGSAFFTAKPRTDSLSAMRVVPSKFIDGLTGGGGNPAIPITSDQQKGDPNATPQVKPPPRPPQPKRVEAAQPQPRVSQPPPPQPTVARIPKDPLDLKPVKRTKPNSEMADVKPTTRSTKTSKSDADARSTRDAADKMAKQFDKALNGLQQSGFNQGTKIEVGGPGGEAFADYGQYVKQMYDDAWVLPPDLLLDSGATVVKVTIARDGHIIHAAIVDKSGQRPLDQSVQRALEKVTKLRPFPAETKDEQRSFTIEFNLKARRSAA